LEEVLSGKRTPNSPNEAVQLAELSAAQKRFAAATRLSDYAFVRDPQLVAKPITYHRYNAACWALLAVGKDSKDAPAGHKEQAALRRQALEWLHHDLASYKRPNRPPSLRGLSHWLTDPDLSSVRDAAIELLPADEQEGWRKLWAEVRATVEAR
jgi:hypothetical protein